MDWFRRFLFTGLVFLPGLCAPAFSQTATPLGPELPHFEASSVKVVQLSRGGFEHQDAGRMEYHGRTLLRLVPFAFDTEWYLIEWPKSLPKGGDTKYDVIATFPTGTSVADQRLMMQSLLRERLGFRHHYEDRSVPIYSMVVAPGGLKAQKAPPTDTVTTTRAGVGMSPTAFRVNGTMPLASALAGFEADLGIPIVDNTGIEGDYEIHLSVPRVPAHPSGSPAGAIKELSAAEIAEMNGFDKAAFFSAVEKQLGLKLERRMIPGKVLVIDGVNTEPTPN